MGDDGRARCGWGAATPEYRAYHDLEWGRPVGDDAAVLETLCLEGFQAGLSWLTILRKREAFRQAFASFDPSIVASFGDGDVERLLADRGIVRHRAKIVATIANARATLALEEQGLSLAGLVWHHRPQVGPAPRRLAEVPPSIPEAAALSAVLRRRGFAFVGPATAYASLQALGVVDDHLEGCDWRSAVEEERRRFAVPPLERPRLR